MRALAFGLVSVLIGVLGHAASSSCSPQVLVLVAGVPLATAYGWLFADRRQGVGSLLAGVGALQAIAHVACTLQTPTISMHGMHHAGAGHDAATMAAANGGSTSMVAMLAVHLGATVIGMFVLLRLERALWGAATIAGRAVLRATTSLLGRSPVAPAGRTASSDPAPTAGADSPVDARASQWFAATCGRRGPPVLALA